MLKLLPIMAIFGGLAAASTFSPVCTGTGTVPTELNNVVSCGQFNNGLGVLQSIQITLSGGISGTITLNQTSTTTQSMKGTESSDFNVAALPGFVIPIPLFTAAYNTGFQNVAPSTPQTFTLSNNQNLNLGTDSNAATFATYTGAGNFLINVTTSSTFSISGGGGQAQASQSTGGFLNAAVVYTYTSSAVPEPTTVSLIGLGLIGVGFIGRRKAR